MKKRVAIGCDPNASELKEIIKKSLDEWGYEFTDMGSDDPVYANVAFKVGEAVARGDFDRGILICGTGIGIGIAANKVPGVYAALCSDVYSAERAIKSNNTNVMTMGSQTIGPVIAVQMVKTYLEAEWEPGCRSEPKVQAIFDYAAKHDK